MSIQSLCIHRVTIEIQTVTQGDGAGKIYDWATVKSNFPCRVVPKSSEESEKLDKESQRARHHVYSYLNPAAGRQHRLVWVDPQGVTRKLYVKGDRNPHGMSRYYFLDCEERRDQDNVLPA